MDNSKHLKDSAHLLDDLESIRQLLGDDPAQPPLLTESVHSDEQIPLLFDVVTGQVVTLDEHEAHLNDIPLLTPEPPAAIKPPAPAGNASSAKAPNADALLHLDAELRAAAQLIMQDVIDDFAPHIENEIKRRLDARMERLLSQYNS
ncbi:DNA polymerase III subunit chi [Pseudomonas petrae]|uniref:DNA polymerase III subunit chi n=1 Tax=Pseudomonas petrae TaxID=2912190 RepID=A0ABS9I251_9PSED|nr:DNA polymerase III subunit chi [Pseudomonas petrae]MCF7533255.1 DNA polymerase III subunit chi [Pseudomonas petrae]MCF7538499.1 DNA polymerase III subunit chi [Pseudomonas petrae]MCF7541436.1 DNA polymerase III subunit chi [Pseudomonas petrae]MCF7556146.1 DNA polymerase III subunit chi [Pseudomonas petrae]